jgi:hypothetical protein
MTRMMESDLNGSWVLKATIILYAGNEVGNLDKRRKMQRRRREWKTYLVLRRRMPDIKSSRGSSSASGGRLSKWLRESQQRVDRKRIRRTYDGWYTAFNRSTTSSTLS